jgi:hypothetical protein
MGNAGLTFNVPLILPFVKDKSKEMREQVAEALRKTDLPEVRDALHRLAVDREAQVQAESVNVLSRWTLDKDNVQRIAKDVINDRLDPRTDEKLVYLFIKHPFLLPDVSRALQKIYDRNENHDTLRLRIRGLFERLEILKQLAKEDIEEKIKSSSGS